MPATATNGSPGLARTPHGSLNAMRLGAQTLDQLAELVNWDNAQNFQVREVNPWTGLDSTSDPQSKSTFATAPEEPISAPSPSITAESRSADLTVDPPVVAGTQESDEANAGLSESTSHQEAPPEPLSQSDESINEDQILPTPSHHAASSDDKDLNEAHEVASQQDLQTENTVLERGEAVKAEYTSPKSSQDDKDSVLPIAQAKQAVEVSNDRPKVDPKRTIPVTSGLPAQMRLDAMTTNPSKASSAQANVDHNYLHRLESLVLELNLQLARINTPINDEADYSQWLSQRVIDLSLQNMALQEELAKHRTK